MENHTMVTERCQALPGAVTQASGFFASIEGGQESDPRESGDCGCHWELKTEK